MIELIQKVERALTSVHELIQKSFGTRSDAGSCFVERILSVWATCKKQGVALIDWLTDALQAAAGLRVTPTLLPA